MPDQTVEQSGAQSAGNGENSPDAESAPARATDHAEPALGLFERLRHHKVAQWTLAYAAGAYTLLHAVEMISGALGWPHLIVRLTTLVLLLGVPVVAALAWFEGHRARQRVGSLELAVLTLVFAIAGGMLWVLGRPGADTAHSTTRPDGASAAEASIAVLPLVALTAGADDGYFADGLTEEIINALSTLPDLLVTARTSAFHFKGKDVPIQQIAATLGVTHVVEGSVRRSGDKVRIAAKLVRASDGFLIWSQTYDRPLGDTLEVQMDIAGSVASALGVLLDDRRRALMRDTGVGDVRAFIAYQRGVELFDRAHSEGPLIPTLAQANVHFDEAIAIKPDLAQAYFQHADLYAHLLIDEAPGKPEGYASVAGVGTAEAAQRLAADLDAAFRHERDPGQRLVIQALRTTVSADWRRLKDQIASAYAAWNNCRHGLWLDQTAITFGFGEAALAHDVKRLQCDPLGGRYSREAITAVWIGRALDGLEYADRQEERLGQNRYVMQARILAYLALGRLDEAEALFAAGNFGVAGVPEFMTILALQIPAAAGRAEEWARLRPSLGNDLERVLVGAAVFGDRATANRVAAEIDSLTLGPLILLRVTDRCGCGSPFDLAATPNLSRLLREGSLPWAPAAPIRFPLKTW